MSTSLPPLKVIPKRQEMIQEFGGYNHNLRTRENEFDDMKNMSSSYYPVLSPRGKRGTLTLLTKPNGLSAKNNLFWVDGTTLYYNGVPVSGLTLADSVKQFVSMGAYLLIWPDKKYFNTADSSYGSLEASITISGTVTCTLTKEDGTAYATPSPSPTAPLSPQDKDLWLDTSASTHVLKQYSAASGTWMPIATTYVKITATNIGKQFKKDDGVSIIGLNTAALNGSKILTAASDNEIILEGILDATASQTGGVTVARSIPDMDFLIENENRVWGCSSAKHELYCCKLGDPFNWNYFGGISSDSYVATIGTDGDFTGVQKLNSQVCFFKENYLHKVYGNKPANFQITTTPCRGIEKGSEGSAVLLNERLYYKGRTAICMYDGSFPVEISAPLGDARYTSGVAGSLGNKYYISMKDISNTWHLFVYDEQKGLWHHEDNAHASYFTAFEGELFFIDAVTKKIMTVNGRISVHEGGAKYDAVNGGTELDPAWYAETGEIGLDMPGNKYISRLLFRLDVAEETDITISLKYNGKGDWEDHVKTFKPSLQSVLFNIIPRRCDHLRIKIAGTKGCKLYSITKGIEEARF